MEFYTRAFIVHVSLNHSRHFFLEPGTYNKRGQMYSCLSFIDIYSIPCQHARPYLRHVIALSLSPIYFYRLHPFINVSAYNLVDIEPIQPFQGTHSTLARAGRHPRIVLANC